jgi:hypothetical protein
LIGGSAQNNKYVYDVATQKVVVKSGAAPPAEVSRSHPASVTSDVVDFQFTFNKF